ncbi:glycine cleavage system P-protein-domain-containing protein [Chytriomyces sp. MP71]|nr:glycine cleavage system P-protein-domain-containing protein [Chytriomyces sp. MP71]
MIQDFTGLPMANASLLNDRTAAGEAMLMCFSNFKKDIFFVDERTFPLTISVLKTRFRHSCNTLDFAQHKGQVMGVLLQAHDNGALVTVATALLACALFKPPGEFGVTLCLETLRGLVCSLGYGGPHAAFFAVKDEHKRRMPGRLIGVSKDANGKTTYRLAWQTSRLKCFVTFSPFSTRTCPYLTP